MQSGFRGVELLVVGICQPTVMKNIVNLLYRVAILNSKSPTAAYVCPII